MGDNFEKITFTKNENLALTRLINEQLASIDKIKKEEKFLSKMLFEKTSLLVEQMNTFYNRILTKVELLTDIEQPENKSDD